MPSRKIIRAAVALAAVVFLTGFVPPPLKVLDLSRKGVVTGPARARASLDGTAGFLEIVAPGLHRFVPDPIVDESTPVDQATPESSEIFTPVEPLTDPGPGRGGELQPLWRALDFFSPLAGHELIDILRLSRIDLTRRGWVRLDEEGDRLAVTLGAMGESEPDRSQVWIDNSTNRLVSVRLPDYVGGEAVVGPSQEPTKAGGWFGWIKLSDGRLLQLITPPEPFEPVHLYEQRELDASNEEEAVKDPLSWWRTLLVDEGSVPLGGTGTDLNAAPENTENTPRTFGGDFDQTVPREDNSQDNTSRDNSPDGQETRQ